MIEECDDGDFDFFDIVIEWGDDWWQHSAEGLLPVWWYPVWLLVLLNLNNVKR